MCAKFCPDRLRFGSTRAKNLFWSKTEPSIGLTVNDNDDDSNSTIIIDNFIHRKQTIEHNTNQIKLNNN